MTDYKPIYLPSLPQISDRREINQYALTAMAIGAIGLMAVIAYLISVYLPGEKGQLSQAHNQIEKLLQENAALQSELEDAQSRLSGQQQAIETLQAQTQSQQELLSQIHKLSQSKQGEN